jgi:hypothetical protein
MIIDSGTSLKCISVESSRHLACLPLSTYVYQLVLCCPDTEKNQACSNSFLRVRSQAAQNRRQCKTRNHPAFDTHHLPLALDLIRDLQLRKALKVPMTLESHLLSQLNHAPVLRIIRITSLDSRIRPARPTRNVIRIEAHVAILRPGAHLAFLGAVGEDGVEGREVDLIEVHGDGGIADRRT